MQGRRGLERACQRPVWNAGRAALLLLCCGQRDRQELWELMLNTSGISHGAATDEHNSLDVDFFNSYHPRSCLSNTLHSSGGFWAANKGSSSWLKSTLQDAAERSLFFHNSTVNFPLCINLFLLTLERVWLTSCKNLNVSTMLYLFSLFLSG